VPGLGLLDRDPETIEIIAGPAFRVVTQLEKETTIAGVSGSEQVELPYAGPALEPGMYYQFRATSWRETGGGGERLYISRTEDLRGVFVTGEAEPAAMCEHTGGADSGGSSGG